MKKGGSRSGIQVRPTAAGVLLALVTLLMFTSCLSDKGPYIVRPEVVVPVDTLPKPTVFPYTISFTTHIRKIFTRNCVMGCHNPSHPKLDLRPPVAYAQLLTDGFSAPYVNPVNPEHSNLYLHLAGVYELMPRGGPKLPQPTIDTVYTWIAQGALNN